MACAFELLEHPSDIGVLARGRSRNEALIAASNGLVSILVNPVDFKPLEERFFKATGSDEAAIIVNWLNEILFFFDTEGMVFVECEIESWNMDEVVGRALAMPDIHQGYGFPIGGVAAMDEQTGVVSPGGVGFDINCGVRLLSSSLTLKDVKPRLRDLVHQLFRDVPSGTGQTSRLNVSESDLNQILEKGPRWAIEHDMGSEADLDHTEERGCIAGADPNAVSARAKQRGRPQLGTLGSGNHFLEVQYVDEIFDERTSSQYNLSKGRIVVLIHTGSRGLGHQVCTDYVAQLDEAMPRYDLHLPDRQLACAPIHSPEGQRYLHAMAGAANFAWTNRQAICHSVRGAFKRIFSEDVHLPVIYDVAHNIAKFETHTVDGARKRVLVHR